MLLHRRVDHGVYRPVKGNGRPLVIGLAIAAAASQCDRKYDSAPDAHGIVGVGATGASATAPGAGALPAASRPPPGGSSVPAGSAGPFPLDSGASPAPLGVSAAASSTAAAAASSSSGKGPASTCRVLRGPIQLPFRGSPALVARGDALDVVSNDDGRPRVTSFPTPLRVSATPGPASAPLPPREPLEAGAAWSLRVPCAVAESTVFCPDRNGAVHRSTLAGADDRIVASSRKGTRIAARDLGERSAVAYLASRQTSEGWVSEAWIAVDDELPQRLSEDGSGATAVTLASPTARAPGGSLLALSVDARAALTAMHARVVSTDPHDRALHLGEDTVVFVGGPGERRTAATLVLPAAGPGWALMPIARDVADFGLALVRLDDPPRVDEPVTWSTYPNGLDPSPVAAVSDGKRFWVARVRPRDAAPGSARLLELGELTPDERDAGEATFTARQVVTTVERGDVTREASEPSDVTLALDARSALWVGWVDAGGSWIEQLACR